MWQFFRFLLALWQANLLAAMEYRAAFLTMVIGMMVNNAAYFVFWIIFFDRFKQVRGWGLTDLLLLFGVAASAFGLSVLLFGRIISLSETISKGQLDYYLSLPQPVLIHTLASHSVSSGLGDFIYGLLSFAVAGQFSPDALLRFIVGTVLGMAVFVGFMTLVHSLAFWLGNAQLISTQAFQSMITFALYPITLFDGSARFLLFTLIPAAFIAAVPVEYIRSASWQSLLQLLAAAVLLLAAGSWLFYRGLRRYESGSAINAQV